MWLSSLSPTCLNSNHREQLSAQFKLDLQVPDFSKSCAGCQSPQCSLGHEPFQEERQPFSGQTGRKGMIWDGSNPLLAGGLG